MTTKIRFLYHSPKGERGIGKAIVIWTWFLGLFYNWKVLKYSFSHEEVWLPDEDEHFMAFLGMAGPGYKEVVFPICGQCFSSTTRGNAKGVRFAPASEVLKHPERWSYIECEVDAERLEVAVCEAKRLVGCRYDFLGTFGFLNPLPIQDSKRWYCSEICDWFKVLLKIHPKRQGRVSPRRSAYLLSRKYGEPIPLVV